MLVIRRQPGESFRVGPDIEIRILSVERGQVKIGIIAPPEVAICRTELAELNRRALEGGSKRDELKDLAGRLLKPKR